MISASELSESSATASANAIIFSSNIESGVSQSDVAGASDPKLMFASCSRVGTNSNESIMGKRNGIIKKLPLLSRRERKVQIRSSLSRGARDTNDADDGGQATVHVTPF